MDHSNKDIVKYALANALWAAMYVILIGFFFNSTQYLFGDTKTVLIPIAMLMLFVFSATLMGTLILGRPILWYMDAKKKEAITLFGYTLGVFFIVMILMWIVLFTLK